MIDIRKRTVDGEATMVAPPKSVIQAGADKSVGVRMNITPSVAAEWLETRGNNRKLTQSIVDEYSAEMKAGKWVFNGAPIQFDEEGKLLNGQHRLWAVLDSGVTIDVIVQWGIPRSTQATIDAGHKWMSKDVLGMHGEINCNLLQAALAWLNREASGSLLSTLRMTNTAAMKILELHPNIRESVHFIASHKGRALVLPSVAAYLHYKFSAVDPDRANEFFNGLSHGIDLAVNSPVYRLRERVLRSMTSKEKLTNTDMMALTIIAWNAFVEGRAVMALLWRKNGPTAQAFPTIVGLPSLGTAKTPRVARAKKGEVKKKFEKGSGTKREVSI